MKKLLLSIVLGQLAFLGFSQNSLNMNLIYHWEDTNLVASSAHNNTYNEIWGYTSGGREYAIIGTTMGTHIFDITDINNVDTVEFIPGKHQGQDIVHRDYDTYQNYLYMVADEGNSSLQIADLSFLPDSAPVIYDADSFIVQSHNIFIDSVSGYLYTCGGVTNLGFNQLSVYGLSNNPADPQFLLNCEFQVPAWSSNIGYLHDIFVRNDTAYCNAGPNGLFIMDFSNLSNIQMLGSMTVYLQSGYNHSGWLNSSGDYYALADENHGLDVKILDVSDPVNITFVDTIGSNVNQGLSIPHNLIFKGDYLYVSYYFDGLYVFDCSDMNNISIAGYYDTSNEPHQINKYEGNWGVYPFLPSNKILASDMQTGLFVFEPTYFVGEEELNNPQIDFVVFPNPVQDAANIITTKLSGEKTSYVLMDMNGKMIRQETITSSQFRVDMSNLAGGIYHLSLIQGNGERVTKKIVKQ